MIMFKPSIFFIYLTNYGIKPSVLLIGIYNWLQNEFCLVFSYNYIFNLIGLLSYTFCWAAQLFIPFVYDLIYMSLDMSLNSKFVALLVIYISVIFEFIGAFLQAYVFGLRFIIYLIK